MKVKEAIEKINALATDDEKVVEFQKIVEAEVTNRIIARKSDRSISATAIDGIKREMDDWIASAKSKSEFLKDKQFEYKINDIMKKMWVDTFDTKDGTVVQATKKKVELNFSADEIKYAMKASRTKPRPPIG